MRNWIQDHKQVSEVAFCLNPTTGCPPARDQQGPSGFLSPEVKSVFVLTWLGPLEIVETSVNSDMLAGTGREQLYLRKILPTLLPFERMEHGT